MDDLFDDAEDLLDITEPEGLVFLASVGLFDGEERCGCWCGCERPVKWAGAECDACREGRHQQPGALEDDR